MDNSVKSSNLRIRVDIVKRSKKKDENRRKDILLKGMKV